MRRWIMASAVLLVILCTVGVMAAAPAVAAVAPTDEPNQVMLWIVTGAASLVSVFVVNWLKKWLAKWLGEALSNKWTQTLAWATSYAVAMLAYVVGGAVTGIKVWTALLDSGWMILAAGSTVSQLASLAYNIWSGAKTTTT